MRGKWQEGGEAGGARGGDEDRVGRRRIEKGESEGRDGGKRWWRWGGKGAVRTCASWVKMKI